MNHKEEMSEVDKVRSKEMHSLRHKRIRGVGKVSGSGVVSNTRGDNALERYMRDQEKIIENTGPCKTIVKGSEPVVSEENKNDDSL